MDYEKDEFAGEAQEAAQSAAAVIGDSPLSSISDDLRAAAADHAEAQRPGRHNRWREEARLRLSNLRWTDSRGKQHAIRWTVDCESSYQILCHCAGLNRPQGGPPITGVDLLTYIFLWLSIHGREVWFRTDPEFGRALKDDPDWWLEVISEWAGREFDITDPDRLDRKAAGDLIRAEVLTLSHASRAEPLPDDEPEEDPSGN